MLLAVAFIATSAKPYYLAGLFPLLLATGAPTVLDWARAGRVRARLLAAALLLTALVNAVLMLPLVPADRLAATPIPAINYDAAETVGWPAFATTIASVRASLPDTHVAVLTRNYGEAGAVDHYLPALAPAHSGHNAYWDWGPPPDDATAVIVIGYREEQLRAWFGRVDLATHIDNHLGLDNDEQRTPVWIARAPSHPGHRPGPNSAASAELTPPATRAIAHRPDQQSPLVLMQRSPLASDGRRRCRYTATNIGHRGRPSRSRGCAMGALLIGYARVSTDEQTSPPNKTRWLRWARVYLDHGLTGTNRDRPGLRETLAACRDGDTLVVTKLDRLARTIADELTARQVRLRPDQHAHQGRNEDRQDQGAATRKEAQTHPAPGSTPGLAARHRRLHHRRARCAVPEPRPDGPDTRLRNTARTPHTCITPRR